MNDLAEKITDMQMDQSDRFLKSVLDMAGRDHKTRMKEFGNTNKLLLEVLTKNTVKKSVVDDLDKSLLLAMRLPHFNSLLSRHLYHI